jgi:hypothetical protein
MTTTNPEHQPRPTKLPKEPPAPFVIIPHRLRVLFTALNYSSISDVLSSISALLEDLNRAYRELTAVRDATEFPLDLCVIRHKHLDIRFQLIEYSVKNAKNPNALSRTQPFPEWAWLGYPLVPRSKPSPCMLLDMLGSYKNMFSAKCDKCRPRMLLLPCCEYRRR